MRNPMSRFTKVLVANRGEIAVRVIRGAKKAGYQTVAVYSDADRNALHVREADQAVHIGPAPAKDSYLLIDRIIEAARRSGAQAIHPGYGFLSERAEFAQAIHDAGLVFVGPDAASIEAMGNKSTSKNHMLAAGVPCVPGYQGDDQSDATLIAEARKVGLPVMVKAASGGGGRGMRLVHDDAELGAAIKSARSEAENAFGSGQLLIEKAVLNARHVEIQIFGDRLGNVVHLGERDCSVQRRNQKVVEEAPSPAVDPALRERMGAAAVAAAKAVHYVGAGTVEFMCTASTWSTGSCVWPKVRPCPCVRPTSTKIVTATPLKCACVPKTRWPVTCRKPGTCCNGKRPAEMAYASTVIWKPAPPSARSTTPCRPSSSPGAKTAKPHAPGC